MSEAEVLRTIKCMSCGSTWTQQDDEFHVCPECQCTDLEYEN